MQVTTPLVVFIDTVQCDQCQHDATLYTDGTVGLAFFEADDLRISGLSRTDSRVLAECSWVDCRSGEPCGGQIVWDLATESWEAVDSIAREALADAERIER